MPLEDYSEKIDSDIPLACCDVRGCLEDGYEVVEGYTFCLTHFRIVRGDEPVDAEVVDDIEAIGIAVALDDSVWRQLKNRYSYHAPKGDQLDRYQRIREAVLTLAVIVVGNTPVSREQSVALTHLDQVMFNANAAIARNE